MNKLDSDIRSKIIITDDVCHNNLTHFSDIVLAAIYSKNENNFNILELLLKNNKNIRIINETLKYTVRHLKTTSSFDAIKLLIVNGADINYIGHFGWPILMDCCINLNDVNIEIINCLIENGSNINIKLYPGITPLTILINFSSSYDHLEIIKLLIRKGAEINYKDIEFGTPLMMCFKEAHNIFIRYDIIKFLLDNKADVYIKNKEGKNIFDIVESKIGKNTDIYSLIFNYKNLVNDHFCDFDINFIY